MKACVLAFLATPLLFAADDRQLALSLKAQSDFERVELSARPRIPDAEGCIQSQAALLSVGLPEERSLIFYRKGLCTFADAAATHNARQFLNSAADFDKSIEAWSLRIRKNPKHTSPEPVSSALRVFAGIARLQASSQPEAVDTARQEIAAALESPLCNSNLMPASSCRDLLTAGEQWLGWMALGTGKLEEAARYFSTAPSSGWSAWVEGRRNFAGTQYKAAADQYGKAIDQWKHIWEGEGPTFLQSLGPRPQYATALADWGGARILSGDLPGAIATLDSALQLGSANAHALFLRARAKELSGQKDAALVDYNMASRTAFAAAQDLASGEAHLYRGIVLFRRKDFARAEEEFASALNFVMTDALLPDARAWRHLSAVAAGSCGTARQSLSAALNGVSPFFPRDEARSLADACSNA